ncbi:hypothetical protein [Aquipuribacter nitratireducens]|uniref:Uncharacterized protein n=1 Tax=Aquipuribacter nitratireducens TaxID=650104 RepID=A0ABW0GUQ5_9MICO
MALATARLQDPEHRRVTVVLPDRLTDEVRGICAESAADWPGELRLLPLPQPERGILPRLGDPGRNHAYQIITGVRASKSTHVLLHDADLFLPGSGAHREQFERAVAHDAVAVGVEPAWDPWFAARGRTLAATWDMVASVEWLRSFPPHRLMGHDAEVDGQLHTFDTTFWGQLHTPQERLLVAMPQGGVLHFNYVISTYRRFLRARGPFRDKNFRLLLVRAFTDLFDPRPEASPLPHLEGLVAGLGKTGAQVCYSASDAAAYQEFRSTFDAMLRGPWARTAASDLAEQYLRPFDDFFAEQITGR